MGSATAMPNASIRRELRTSEYSLMPATGQEDGSLPEADHFKMQNANIKMQSDSEESSGRLLAEGHANSIRSTQARNPKL
jgi:hypothetical protein